MEKKTVIANIHAEISLGEALQSFLAKFEDQENAWFARRGGDLFLGEYGSEWNSVFVDAANTVVDGYFRHINTPEDRLPTVEITDSRRGSWIIDASIVMFGTIGTVYTILKGISELPALADGLEQTKQRLQKELSQRFKKKVLERIEPVISTVSAEPLPAPVRAAPVDVSCSIDARPLRGLTPDVAKAHAIHLAVAVSRSALSVENLGDAPITNLRIGLFKSGAQRHSWNFGDAFSKSVPQLSSKQSTSLSIDQFASGDGSTLDLSEGHLLFVDCWLQNNSGIYLFNFFLE